MFSLSVPKYERKIKLALKILERSEIRKNGRIK